MSIPGPTQNRPTHGKMIKALALLNKRPDPFPAIILPKTPTVKAGLNHRPARAPYKQEEAVFRTILISHLRKKGCKVERVEPYGRGKFDLADLWVDCARTNWMGWVETKSLTGGLSPGQRLFKDRCKVCKVNYLVARNLDDTKEIYEPL